MAAGDSEAERDPTSHPALMRAGLSANLLFRLAYTPSVLTISKTPEYSTIRNKILSVYLRTCEDCKRGFTGIATTMLSVKTAVEAHAREQLQGEQEKDKRTLARIKITDKITAIPAYGRGKRHRRVQSTDMILPGMSESGRWHLNVC